MPFMPAQIASDGDALPKSAGAVDPKACNNASLRMATRHAGQLFDEILVPSGLRATQHGLLAFIAGMDAPTVKALAARLVMDVSALSHTLKPLLRDGYVTVTPDDRDRRSKRIRLTDRGRDKLSETTALWIVAQRHFEAALGEEKARRLRELLDTVASEEFGALFRSTQA